MSTDQWHVPRFSNEAIAILGDLRRHGGSMRIVPLFRRSGLDGEAFLSALRELHERLWVHVAWRRCPRAAVPPGLPERLREVDRITLTRFGRWRCAAAWPSRP